MFAVTIRQTGLSVMCAAVLLAATVASALWAPARGEEIRRDEFPVVPLTAQQKKDFEFATRSENPLARMERLAHEYAYGDGPGEGWADRKLLARMQMDGFWIRETIIDPADGFAAMVVYDEKTKRSILVPRGSDASKLEQAGVSGRNDPNVPETISDVTVGITQYEDHAKAVTDMAERWAKWDGQKLDVAGHSRGGSIGTIFTANNPHLVNVNYTFQAPAVTEDMLNKFEVRTRALNVAEAERPKTIATVVTDDPVSREGTALLPGTRLVAVLPDRDSPEEATLADFSSHTAFCFQNTGLRKWTGKDYSKGHGVLTTGEFEGREAEDILRDLGSHAATAIILEREIDALAGRIAKATNPTVAQNLTERMEKLRSNQTRWMSSAGLDALIGELERKQRAAAPGSDAYSDLDREIALLKKARSLTFAGVQQVLATIEEERRERERRKRERDKPSREEKPQAGAPAGETPAAPPAGETGEGAEQQEAGLHVGGEPVAPPPSAPPATAEGDGIVVVERRIRDAYEGRFRTYRITMRGGKEISREEIPDALGYSGPLEPQPLGELPIEPTPFSLLGEGRSWSWNSVLQGLDTLSRLGEMTKAFVPAPAVTRPQPPGTPATTQQTPPVKPKEPLFRCPKCGTVHEYSKTIQHLR